MVRTQGGPEGSWDAAGDGSLVLRPRLPCGPDPLGENAVFPHFKNPLYYVSCGASPHFALNKTVFSSYNEEAENFYHRNFF